MDPMQNIDFDSLAQQLNVPALRKPKFTAWLSILIGGLKKLYNTILLDYMGGAGYPSWSSITAYNFGDKVTSGNGVTGISTYECIVPNTGNPPTDTNYWYAISVDNIGLIERSAFNAQLLKLEYVLNRRFNPLSPSPPYGSAYVNIYITNNVSYPPILWCGKNGGSISKYVFSKSSNKLYYCLTEAGVANYMTSVNYVIHVPTAILTSLSYSLIDASNMMRHEVDKYNTAGITYTITNY